jgi:hypothetical protein
MLVFHNDQLVPPELCRLLYHTIPPEYHVPVIFLNLPHPVRPTALGLYFKTERRIDICLNPIFRSAGRTPGSAAFSLWYRLLNTCYHEFGHVAKEHQHWDVSLEDYSYSDRAWRFVEDLAISWANRKLGELRDHDPRLAQPAHLNGYFGARLCDTFRSIQKHRGNEILYWGLKQWRCRKTGGQLSASDVLNVLRISPSLYPSEYRLLRTVSDGIGVIYINRASRHHLFYEWGDVPTLGTRLVQTGKLVRKDPSPPPCDWSGQMWDQFRDQPERPDWEDEEWDSEHDLPDELWDRPDFPGWDEDDVLSPSWSLDVA